MHNIKLIIEYDGTNYHGWQRQKNAITIQEKIEDALKILTGANINLMGAGRTDAGAHARGQTANFRIDALAIPVNKLPYAINTLLPEDVIVKHAEEAAEDFHARFCAKEKFYSYNILNSRFPSPLLRKYSFHYPRSLDINKMKQAGNYLVGTHDFASFIASGSNVKTTVREIRYFDIQKNGELICATFRGDGFLYNMVRIIMGTILLAGEGKVPPEYILHVIRSKKRENAGMTLPSKGLILEKVIY